MKISQGGPDLNLLHPAFRAKLELLLSAIQAEALPFAVFCGYRSPMEQFRLYSQGRTAPGNIVTRAKPWQSFHQFGLAADLVLREHGQWSWRLDHETGPWWQRMHELAHGQGLQTLSFEKPHVELDGILLEQIRLGHYPPGGDWSWSDNLSKEIMAWHGDPPGPPTPLIA